LFALKEGHEAVQQHLMGPHSLKKPAFGSDFELMLKCFTGLCGKKLPVLSHMGLEVAEE
jgi:hypothetical protein